MLKQLKRVGAAAVVLGVTATSTLAAGSGTGIEAGFTEVGTDLDTLLNGAGGFIVIVVSITLAAIMLAIGRGWGTAATSFACAMFLGYGVTAFQGVSGVTATTDVFLSASLADEDSTTS